MLVRFASDRRTYQGGAKRNRRMQNPSKIELVFGTARFPMKMGTLIRTVAVKGLKMEWFRWED